MARIFDATAGVRPTNWTFTRGASAATHINSSGLLVNDTAANTERLDYSLSSVGTILGLLIEVASTNLLINSSNPYAHTGSSGTNGVWYNARAAEITNTAQTDIAGGTLAITYAFTNPGDLFAEYLTGLTSGSTYTLSGYARSGSTTPGTLLHLGIGNSNNQTGGSTINATYGQYFYTVAINETSKYVGPTSAPTGTAKGQDTSAAAKGNIDFCFPQFELLAKATTYIPTGSTTASRSVESASFLPNLSSYTITFDDGSTQTISTTPGTTYTLTAASLNRPRVLYIDETGSYSEAVTGSIVSGYARTTSKTSASTPSATVASSKVSVSKKVSSQAQNQAVVSGNIEVGGRPQINSVATSYSVQSQKVESRAPNATVVSSKVTSSNKSTTQTETTTITSSVVTVSNKSSLQAATGAQRTQGYAIDNTGTTESSAGGCLAQSGGTTAQKSITATPTQSIASSASSTDAKANTGSAQSATVASGSNVVSRKVSTRSPSGTQAATSSCYSYAGVVEPVTGSTTSGRADVQSKTVAQTPAGGAASAATSVSAKATMQALVRAVVSSPIVISSKRTTQSATASTSTLGMGSSLPGVVESATGTTTSWSWYAAKIAKGAPVSAAVTSGNAVSSSRNYTLVGSATTWNAPTQTSKAGRGAGLGYVQPSNSSTSNTTAAPVQGSGQAGSPTGGTSATQNATGNVSTIGWCANYLTGTMTIAGSFSPTPTIHGAF